MKFVAAAKPGENTFGAKRRRCERAKMSGGPQTRRSNTCTKQLFVTWFAGTSSLSSAPGRRGTKSEDVTEGAVGSSNAEEHAYYDWGKRQARARLATGMEEKHKKTRRPKHSCRLERTKRSTQNDRPCRVADRCAIPGRTHPQSRRFHLKPQA